MHATHIPRARRGRDSSKQAAFGFPETLLDARTKNILIGRPDFPSRCLSPLGTMIEERISHFMGTFSESMQKGVLERFKSHLLPSAVLPRKLFYSADAQELFIPTFSSWRKAGSETNMPNSPLPGEFEAISSLLSILEHVAIISPEIGPIQANHLLSSQIKAVSLLMNPKDNTPLRSALSRILEAFDEPPQIPLVDKIATLIPTRPERIVIMAPSSQTAALVGLKLEHQLKRHVYCSSSPFRRINPDFRNEAEHLLEGQPFGITVIHNSSETSYYVRRLLRAANIVIFIGKKTYSRYEAEINKNQGIEKLYVLNFNQS